MDTSNLRQVGEFSQLAKRPLVRSIKNPMDKCTVVSIYPKDISETKCTIEPGIFQLKAGTYENPSLLVVGASSWWKDIDAEQPMVEIPNGSIQIAESIIKDYSNGLLGCNMSDAMPGLFFVLGSVSVVEIKSKYKIKLDEVKIKQDNWYKILVKLADSLWARAGGNPLAISDDMRLAARSLNLNDKPWLKDYNIMEMIKCKACGSLKNPMFPVCPTCRAIDGDHPMAKDLKFA